MALGVVLGDLEHLEVALDTDFGVRAVVCIAHGLRRHLSAEPLLGEQLLDVATEYFVGIGGLRIHQEAVLSVSDLTGDTHAVVHRNDREAAPERLADHLTVGLGERSINEEVRMTVPGRNLLEALLAHEIRAMVDAEFLGELLERLVLGAIANERQGRTLDARIDVLREDANDAIDFLLARVTTHHDETGSGLGLALEWIILTDLIEDARFDCAWIT